MGDEGHTGVNERPGTGMGHEAQLLPFHPFQTQGNHHLSVMAILAPPALDLASGNLILVLRVATIGQMELDLEIKYICNI